LIIKKELFNYSSFFIYSGNIVTQCLLINFSNGTRIELNIILALFFSCFFNINYYYINYSIVFYLHNYYNHDKRYRNTI